MNILLFIKNRVFRSLVFFSTFQGIGSGIFGIFMMWVIHALFQNPIYTGIAGFMFAAPRIAGFAVGPLVDRWNKLLVLKATSLLQFCTIVAILVVNIFFNPNVWFFLVAIFANSVAELFEVPTYKALLPRIVATDDLVNANVFVEIVGIIAGIIVGVGLFLMMIGNVAFEWIYAINAAFMFFAFICAVLLKGDETNTKYSNTTFKEYFGELKEGFSFTMQGVMLPLLLAVVSMSFFADIAYVNLPMFAEVHFGEAYGYILLSGLAILGSLIGTVIFGVVGKKIKLGKVLVVCFVFVGMVRIVFVTTIESHLIGAVLIFILYAGVTSTIGMFYHVLVQKLPPKNLIGRVSTAITSLRAVAYAVGSLAGGVLGTLLADVNKTFILQGISYIAIGLCLCFSGQVRRLSKIDKIKNV